ncbi:MAG TPA: protein kinase, partial [Terriglobales bacterium]
HSEGVIHRDLKPANIMRDQSGRVVIMDFGLARTLQGEGMTQTGMMVGTMEYMSPEQATGLELDTTSDIYAAGLIAYEMLTGKMPYAADSAVASLLKRSQERAKPMIDVDSSIPRDLSTIVSRCIEPDRKKRYQSTAELIADLEGFQPSAASKARGSVAVRRAPLKAARTIPVWAKWGAVSVAVLLVAAAGLYEWKGRLKPQVTHAPVTVLVADLTNHTGDPVLDGTLEPMFNVALEGASFINAFNRGTARKMAQKLPNPTDKLDEQSARLVALSQGISSVITGEISLRGGSYTVSAMALDAATGNVLAKSEATAANKDEVVGTVPKVVAPIRRALGDTTPESAQFGYERGAFTAASIEVVHQYSLAGEQQLAGNMEEAMGHFEKAVQLDPNFSRAYSGMAAMAFNLGQRQLAEENIKLAMEHVDRMTERERYRNRGQYYWYTGNTKKAVEEYKELLAHYPADLQGRFNLAAVYIDLHDFSNAVEQVRRAVEIAPKRSITRQALSFYSSYLGDFQTGEQEARAALELSPSSETSYLALAEAQLGQGQLSQAAETYHKLEKL